jgi:glycosyltransferase involved in cell wall biosynthesis
VSHAAVVIPGLDRIGGAERQTMLLAKGLRQRGWQVSMVALSGSGGEAAAELREAGVSFTSLEMRKGLADPRGWIRLNRWLWRERPDVVHAHLPHAAWLARWSRLAAPVPVEIDTLHSSYTGKLGRRIGYVCSRWLADKVTAVSEATAEAHRAAGMVGAKKLLVLGNGIDVNAWRPEEQMRAEARQALGLKDEFLWLAVGRLETVKDYPTLLRALAGLPKAAQLLILGEGPLHNELARMAVQLGVESRVRFLGFSSEVRRWMQAADGVVLASRYEGLPMVLLEAGACGKPVVATDVAGTREVVENGWTGWLARQGDADSLAAAMEKLMSASTAGRRAIGEWSQSEVTRRFGLESILDRWEALYGELLDRSRTRRRIALYNRAHLRRRKTMPA